MASDIHSVVSYSMPQNLCSSELVPPMVARVVVAAVLLLHGHGFQALLGAGQGGGVAGGPGRRRRRPRRGWRRSHRRRWALPQKRPLPRRPSPLPLPLPPARRPWRDRWSAWCRRSPHRRRRWSRPRLRPGSWARNPQGLRGRRSRAATAAPERKPRRLTEGAAAGFELPVGQGADGVLGWVHSVMMFPPSCLSASGAGPLPEPQRSGPIFARQVR